MFSMPLVYRYPRYKSMVCIVNSNNTVQNEEIRNIIEEVNEKYYGSNIKTGEIYPTNTAPVLVAKGQQLEPAPLIWGFPHFKHSGVIINARAETAEEKKMFKSSLLERRCVIPSTGFYEWMHNNTKQKYLFNLSDTPTLYMAGFFNEFKDEKRFIILTTDANPSISDVHSRMPVVLQKICSMTGCLTPTRH